MPANIQQQLFKDRETATLFERALQHGLDYLQTANEREVYPSEAALQQLEEFAEDFPSQSTPATAVVDTLHQYGSPATVTVSGGRYFGFVNGSYVPAGLAAKLIGDFWDQNTAMQVLSPIAARLETVVEGWLADIFGLPSTTVTGFVSGSSMANFCALAAARYRLLAKQNWDVNQRGLWGAPAIRVVTGKQAHSTVKKSLALLGIGLEQVEWVPVDEQGRILVDALPALDSRTLLILQAGEVNSGAFDHFSELCKRARAADAWVHIDGAFGLWAAAAKEFNYLTKGIELAHSWAADGHKTLNTPYDCGLVMCVDQEALVSSLHMGGSYLVLSEQGRDSMFYTPEMSRRARVVEVWATLKNLGRQGLDEMVSNLCYRAQQFATEIGQVAGFTVLNDVVFNQVIVRCGSDELTDAVIAEIQAQRTCWVGGSVWEGRKVIRISVCSWLTTAEDISRAVASFSSALSVCEKVVIK